MASSNTVSVGMLHLQQQQMILRCHVLVVLWVPVFQDFSFQNSAQGVITINLTITHLANRDKLYNPVTTVHSLHHTSRHSITDPAWHSG